MYLPDEVSPQDSLASDRRTQCDPFSPDSRAETCSVASEFFSSFAVRSEEDIGCECNWSHDSYFMHVTVFQVDIRLLTV